MSSFLEESKDEAAANNIEARSPPTYLEKSGPAIPTSVSSSICSPDSSQAMNSSTARIPSVEVEADEKNDDSRDGDNDNDNDDTETSFSPSSYMSIDSLPPTLTLTHPFPSEPLPWTWRCHLCGRRYRLSITRRCLHDGHLYCSGEPEKNRRRSRNRSRSRSRSRNRSGQRDTDKTRKRKDRRARSCTSEFDYLGWAAWGHWRRAVLAARRGDVITSTTTAPASSDEGPRQQREHQHHFQHRQNHGLRGCELCDFPSQCRACIEEDAQEIFLEQQEAERESEREGEADMDADEISAETSTAEEELELDPVLEREIDAFIARRYYGRTE